MDTYDVIVIGAGHAGTEASLAASRLGCRTLLITMDLSTIGLMSCNPAIGGVGKGQLVKEIDALGGEMARAADRTAVSFRMLNLSKGSAVHSTRCQSDRRRYKSYIQSVLKKQKGLDIVQAEVTELLVKDNAIYGVKTKQGQEFFGKTLVITPGTFLEGLIHIGLEHFSGGRLGEKSSEHLSVSLKNLGFRTMRFKTGTCPRLKGETINFKKMQIQAPDKNQAPFSFLTRRITQKQIPCYITYTNKATHEIILSNLDKSPLYTKIIKATGVRYCPSIEDKVVKFSDKMRHQIFLEPEGLNTSEFYPNGLSTSLPFEVQMKMLRSIAGLENVETTRPGYGIEHTVIDSTQLLPNLETKLIRNLFFAGQIDGTTGYEEAAAQGLIAGINAALKVKDKPPFVLDRTSSYIGVLLDDLVTKGTNEPYRMFTSRVEYRLLLREDNADLRLRKIGFDIGLIKHRIYQATLKKQKAIQAGINFLKQTRIYPSKKINAQLLKYNTSILKKDTALDELLRRPELDLSKIRHLDSRRFTPLEIMKKSDILRKRQRRFLSLTGLKFLPDVQKQIEIEIKYSGFIQRQVAEVKDFKNLEKIKLPADLDYARICGLSREIREKLSLFKPLNLGQALRISGVTPAAIAILMVYLKKLNDER